MIIAHKAHDRQSKHWAEEYADHFKKQGCRVLVGPSGPHDNPYPVFLASVTEPIDLAVVLGGDGTALAAARHLSPENIPILAANVGGHLGFLTESFEAVENTAEVIDRLFNDIYAVQQRLMVQAAVFEGDRIDSEPVSDWFLALNEICVKPASAHRMPTSILEMEVDREVVDQYQGDGLIIATPTGSTCYNASANGPIIHTGMNSIVVTPICPLSLSSRPIVLPPGSVVSVWPLADPEHETKLWTDGVLATSIWPGQRVDVKTANCEARFIILRKDYSFFQTIQEKLQWAGARIRYTNNHRN